MSKRQRTNNSCGTRQQSTLPGLWKSSSSSCHPSVERDNDNNDDESNSNDNNLLASASKNAPSAAAAASSSLLLLQNKQPQWKNISIQSSTNNNGPMLILRGVIGMKKNSSSIRKSLTALPDWKENVTFNAFGRQCTMRRRICQYSLQGKFTYSYSGLKNVTAPPFPANLYEIKCQVEDMMIDYILNNMNRLEGDLCLSQEFIDLIKKSTNNGNDDEEEANNNNNKRIDIFNYCLLNHYRNGEEYMSYHSDDESSLCPYSPIASVSLGVTRSFDIRHKKLTKDSSSSSGSSSNKNDKTRSRIARIPLGDGDVLLMFPPMQQHFEHSIPVEKRVIGERINLTFRRLL
ncbi:hypothetical protein ACHAWC_008259 [Mediolabrus comicus]